MRAEGVKSLRNRALYVASFLTGRAPHPGWTGLWDAVPHRHSHCGCLFTLEEEDVHTENKWMCSRTSVASGPFVLYELTCFRPLVVQA